MITHKRSWRKWLDITPEVILSAILCVNVSSGLLAYYSGRERVEPALENMEYGFPDPLKKIAAAYIVLGAPGREIAYRLRGE